VLNSRERLEAERVLLQARAVLTPERRTTPYAELVALRVGNALGYAQLRCGRTAEAVATFAEVRDLAAVADGDPARAVEHGIALAGLGEAHQRTGKIGEAERDLRTAIEALTGSAAEYPGARSLARALLTARVRLANLLLQQRKVGEAEALLRAPGVLPPAAESESWMDRALRADLDATLANCILMHCEAGGSCDEAAQLLHGACALLEELVREHPEQVDQQVDLGAALNNLAALANQTGDAAAARHYAEKAIGCQQAVLAVAPETRPARLFLGMHHGQLAFAQAALGQADETVAAAKAALQWAGRHAPTLRLAAEACTRAASGIAAASPDEARAAIVAEGGRVAVAALRQLAKLDRTEARRLVADARFTFLRERADFVALRAEVER
jgi:tetratricopeptide (TPR) repeat protein